MWGEGGGEAGRAGFSLRHRRARHAYSVSHETDQGIEIPCSVEKILCSPQKIPCSDADRPGDLSHVPIYAPAASTHELTLPAARRHA